MAGTYNKKKKQKLLAAVASIFSFTIIECFWLKLFWLLPNGVLSIERSFTCQEMIMGYLLHAWYILQLHCCEDLCDFIGEKKK